MKTECLLVILVIVAMTEGRKSKCQKEKEADPENGPECLDNGKYNPRQCNDTVCWCVDKRSGNPLYDDVKIPVTHRYKCGKEPRGCLKKELDLRMKGITDELKIPLCNKKGYYKPKQCEAVPKRKCRKQERKKRQLGESCYNGTFAEAYNGFINLTGSVSVDSALQWTFVPKSDYVTIDGEVTTIEVNVGAVDRTIKFGVYAPCLVTCQFRLLQHFVWTSPSLGFHVITLGVGERLTVKTGYFLGISWENYGVVEWHTVGTQNYCEDSLTFSPGDSVTLYADRHGNREYDVRYTIEGSTQTKFGFDPIDRDKVDTGMEWTFVNKAPFPNAGRIVALEFWVGGENRELRFGLYRPTVSSGVFEVVRQLVYPAGFPLGFNQVVLSGADIIDVEGGDNFGFTWTNKGVIDYDTSKFTNYFYHIKAAYNEGNTTGTLTDIHGKRIYSIQVCFETCKNTTLIEKDGPCNATTFGLSGLTAEKVDTAAVWTFVQTTPVSREGEVTAIEVNVGAVNRTVKFGVYEPCPYTCQFKLVDEFLWKSSSLGFTVIDIPLGVRCKVKEGFHLGFSWIGYGVIKYENVAEFNYCEDGLTFSEGDTATLVENRYGNRAYDVRFTIESLALWVGYPSIDRDNVDTSSGWTFVLKNNPFPSAGQIVAFEFYVGRANTTIQFGLYRGTAGEFTVIKKLEYASGFPLGHNRVELAGDDIISVEQGDSLGISWPDLGVIDWAPPPPPLTSEYYYYANAIYAEGSTTGTMSDATPISNRCYSFRAEFVCCDKSAPLDAEGQCVQCFCVDKDGTEQEGTRTTEIGDLKCSMYKAWHKFQSKCAIGMMDDCCVKPGLH